MTWRATDPQGNETDKVRFDIVQYTRGVVLDMGCGPQKGFPHWIGVDNCKDTELFGIQMKPDVVCDVADPKAVFDTFESLSVDAIFSSHCLEHIQDYKAALRAWWDLIKVGGHLILYLPHRDLYPQIGTHGANPDHKHDFVPEDILAHFHDEHWNDRTERTTYDVIVVEDRSEGMEYSFLLVIKKVSQQEWDAREQFTYKTPKPAKTACVCRYGGFGDMIQASNVLPELKRQGFHVTVMTTSSGQSVIEHDPHVDDWFIQDNDQVPNHELGAFWAAQAKRFDKFINLSESVEGTLLAIPGRTNHAWPESVRRVELNRNYLEWTAQLAELPYMSEAQFYPSEDEKAKVQRYLGHVKQRLTAAPKKTIASQIMGAGKFIGAQDAQRNVFSIMWVLSGSSIHKAYPWTDAVMAKVLTNIPEAAIILTGDAACQILEAGWENEPRVFRESGEMSIRQTLALAQAVDCVVGPETGVLNAVAFEPNAKVLFLSHSTVENLSKHWVNTVSLSAPEDPSVPICGQRACHRLHYTRDFCPEHKETGAAMCQVSIDPERAYAAIESAYRAWKVRSIA